LLEARAPVGFDTITLSGRAEACLAGWLFRDLPQTKEGNRRN